MAIFVIAKPPTFHTDFNKRDAEGRLVAVPGGGTMYWLGPYPEGTRVRLVDAEGNSCEAVLDEVDGQILKFRPDWETWSESPSFLVADELTFGEGGILRDAATAVHPETRPHVAPSEFAFFSARTAARVNA